MNRGGSQARLATRPLSKRGPFTCWIYRPWWGLTNQGTNVRNERPSVGFTGPGGDLRTKEEMSVRNGQVLDLPARVGTYEPRQKRVLLATFNPHPVGFAPIVRGSKIVVVTGVPATIDLRPWQLASHVAIIRDSKWIVSPHPGRYLLCHTSTAYFSRHYYQPVPSLRLCA